MNHQNIKKFKSLRIVNNSSFIDEESLAIEQTLQIEINNEAFSMTMRTPGADIFLITGLLFSEGFEGPFKNINLSEKTDYTLAQLTLKLKEPIKSQRRFLSTSSCGLCGQISASELYKDITPLSDKTEINIESIYKLYQRINKFQWVFQQTGGTHAAAIASQNGEIICCFEDVGRHNATDKAIGFCLVHNELSDANILLLSGRLSFEIIQKAARAGIEIITAISAPSSKAVEAARYWGVTLIAFCRDDKATIYSRPCRISGEALENDLENGEAS